MVDPQYAQPATPPPARRTTPWLWLVLGGLVALVLIGGGVGLLIYNRLSTSQSDIPTFLGQDTQLYATIAPNLSALQGVERLRAAYPDLFLENDASNADKQLEDLLGVKFKDDVQPWIGAEMAIAVSGLKSFTLEGGSLSGPATEELAREAKVTIVLTSRDQTKAQAFIDKQLAYRRSKGEEIKEEEYSSIKIFNQDGLTNPSPIASFAMIRGAVVFASDVQVLKGIIDRNPSGEDTLAKSARFTAVRASLPQTAAGYIFIDKSAIESATASLLAQVTQNLPPEQVQQLDEQQQAVKALQGIGASISLAQEGVQFDTAVTFDLAQLPAKAKERLDDARTPVSADRLKGISRDAVALLTFRIPETLKQDILDAIKAQKDGEASLKEFEDQFNLSLEKDLLDWFSGEGSLVILPGDKIGDTTLPATAYFALQPKDKGAAEAGMKKIAAAIETVFGGGDGSLKFTSESIGGADWQVVKDTSGDSALFGYGFVEKDLVVALGKSAMGAAGNGKETPVTDSANFKAATAGLPTPSGGVIYVDIGNMLDMYRNSDFTSETFDDKNLKPIKGMAAAGEPGINKDGVARSRFFIFIAAQ
jgi:hypothetical protein